jgi:hypothetical protein
VGVLLKAVPLHISREKPAGDRVGSMTEIKQIIIGVDGSDIITLGGTV